MALPRRYAARTPREPSIEALREMYRLGKNMTLGEIYYVDSTYGAVNNDGLSPNSALSTILAALNLCANDNDDVIIVKDSYQQETFPIEINKSRVHILGVGHWGGMFPQMIPQAGTPDRAIFTINTKGYIEIANFNLGAGATHASIEFISAVMEGRTWIHDVWFGHSNGGQDGIKVAAGTEAPENLIERCVFGKLLTRDGIRIEGQSTRTNIINNIFRNVAAVGIDCVNVTGLDIGAILDNRFSLRAQAALGAAITIAAATAVGGPIDNNHAMEGKVITTNVPYLDAGACDWGLNWRHLTVCPPT